MESLFLPIARPGLFRSRAWLLAWAKVWSCSSEINLLKQGGSAVDLNSLSERDLQSRVFISQDSLLDFFPVLSAYPWGASSRAIGSIRSEYFQFAADPVDDLAACSDFFAEALVRRWDRLIFPDVLAASADYQAIVNSAQLNKLTVIEAGRENTYGVNLNAVSFADYVKGLGKNSRLKLFNSRKRLERIGRVSVENIWPDRQRFLNLLNHFHSLRWGKPCYRDRNETFIQTLLDEVSAAGGKIDFSVMSVDNIPVSAVFDIWLDGRIYNLQSGYIENFAKGVSLGTLHFGYQLEAAFGCDITHYYDFMAGRGKSRNYKKFLANSRAQFVTLTLVRSPLLSCAYKIKAQLQRVSCWLQKISFR